MNAAGLRAFIAEAASGVGGTFGFCIRAGGDEVAWNADQRFPLASVFKIGVLIGLLDRVAAGRERLDTRVTVGAGDISPGSGILCELAPGAAVTVRDLATLMIIVSDNTATDLLCARVGIDRIVESLRRRGYRETEIREDCFGYFARVVGADPDDRGAENRAEVARRLDAGQLIPGADAGDGSTPREMARIFLDVVEGRALGRAETAVAVDLLQRQHAASRIPLLLPSGTTAWHKTGTGGGAVNDCGVIGLPGGGRLAFAALSRDVPEDGTLAAERLIGRVARAAFETVAGGMDAGGRP